MLAQILELASPAALRAPSPSVSPFMDNLLAGIAEKVCDDIGLPRPAWTRRVHSLKDQWLGSGTPRMQADAIAATPEQLSARGIVMRTESLWRDPRTVGS